MCSGGLLPTSAERFAVAAVDAAQDVCRRMVIERRGARRSQRSRRIRCRPGCRGRWRSTGRRRAVLASAFPYSCWLDLAAARSSRQRCATVGIVGGHLRRVGRRSRPGCPLPSAHPRPAGAAHLRLSRCRLRTRRPRRRVSGRPAGGGAVGYSVTSTPFQKATRSDTMAALGLGSG